MENIAISKNGKIKKEPSKKRRFIKDALILTVITLVLRGVGTAFMIYISNTIGAEGIGLYQLTFSIYALFITLSTSGISLAVTRIVSEQLAVNNHFAARSAFRRCILLSIVLSVSANIILLFAAESIGLNILNDSRTVTSLQLLSFALPFLSIASTIRGYFLGMKKGVKAASTDIVEQVIQIIITIPVLTIMAPKGLEYACCGLIIGATIAEIISCIYAVILYFAEKSKYSSKPAGKAVKGISKQIFSIIVPIAVSSYIRSVLVSVENILVPTGLKRYGQTSGEALSQYGMIKGMAMPILLFPSAILSAFANLLVPEVSSASALDAKKRIDYIVNKSFKATLFFAFLIMGIFFCFSTEIGVAFYNDTKVGTMLLILAPLIPLMYLDQIVDSILKGLNQQLSSMKYNTIDSALRAGLIYVLVPVLGIKGYIVMLYAGTIFNALLSINRLIVVSKVKFHFMKWVVLPCFAIIISCVFTKIFLHTNVFYSILMVCFCYVIVLFLMGCLTKRDFTWVIRIFYNKKSKSTFLPQSYSHIVNS